MALTVVGHWEIGWNTPLLEADLWNLPLRDFGVEEWWMWPVTGIQHNEQQRVSLHERHTLDEILAEVEGVRVFVEPRNPQFPLVSTDLQEFVHPENPIYIFGSAHFNPTIGRREERDLAVTIPTVRNNGVLWPHQCLVALLYDRLVKSWQ